MESENTEELEKMVGSFIKSNIDNLILTLQKQYGIDILDFSGKLKLKRPKAWREIAPYWNEAFKNAGIDSEVEVKIINTGQYVKGI
jgi:hypothetical protein